jgi:hypothetical protein
MSIELLSATPLDNASIQYTYPEMDIRGIDKSNDIIKFKFRNGLYSSSFSFTDVDASIFKSGIASEGIISKKKHTYNEDDSTITYELTIKHITSTENNFFYVVFPITSGGKTSFIKSIAESDTPINIINMNSIVNKSLNSIIGDLYSSDVYKYTNNFNNMVFVFKTPITTKINNYLTNVKAIHSEWLGFVENNKIINLIPSGSGGKVSEEIECDYSGDTIKEPEINNKNLSNTFSNISVISFFLLIFGLYTAFFYKFGMISYFLAVLMIAAACVLYYYYMYNKKNNWYSFLSVLNPFNANLKNPWSYGYIILMFPLLNLLYRALFLVIYNIIKNEDESINVKDFFFGYYDINNLAMAQPVDMQKYNSFLLNGLFLIWIIYVCVILVK